MVVNSEEWVCPICETINTDTSCIICGTEKPIRINTCAPAAAKAENGTVSTRLDVSPTHAKNKVICKNPESHLDVHNILNRMLIYSLHVVCCGWRERINRGYHKWKQIILWAIIICIIIGFIVFMLRDSLL